MSKSRGNVISPDEIIEKYGADTLRVYEMFIGPFEQEVSWQEEGIRGVRRFLERVWRLQKKLKRENRKGKNSTQNSKLKKLLHKTIKKVTEDIENFKFNTAISSLMILVNEMEKEDSLFITHYSLLIQLLAPFAPHLAEELWQNTIQNAKCKIQNSKFRIKDSIHLQPWPKYDANLVKEEIITLIVQVNGKVRDKIEVEKGISQEIIENLIFARPKIKKWIEGKPIKKTIFLPDKLINIVI
jgi:leucyl-tRNA synthetase